MMDHFFLGFGDELCKFAARKQIVKSLIRRKPKKPVKQKTSHPYREPGKAIQQPLSKKEEARELRRVMRGGKPKPEHREQIDKAMRRKSKRHARRSDAAGVAGVMAGGASAPVVGATLGKKITGSHVGTVAGGALGLTPPALVGGAGSGAILLGALPAMLARRRMMRAAARIGGKRGRKLREQIRHDDPYK